MLSFTALFCFVAYASLPYVTGHAKFKDPPPREPGPLFAKSCGTKAQESVKQFQASSFIEDFGTSFPDPAKCVPSTCHGFLFEDQPPTEVKKVTPGQKLDVEMLIIFKHNGSAIVQVVSTKTGKASPVGPVLKTIKDFASTDAAQTQNTKFSITLPDSSVIKSGDCATPGDCAVQFTWVSPDADVGVHTYMSCFDVVFGDGKDAQAPPGQAPPGQTPPNQAPPDQTPPTNNLTASVPPEVIVPPSQNSSAHHHHHHHHHHEAQGSQDGNNKTAGVPDQPIPDNGTPIPGTENPPVTDNPQNPSSNSSSGNGGKGKCRSRQKPGTRH